MERDSAYLKRLERQRRENQARRAALEAASLEKDAQYFAEREGAAAYRRQQRSESVDPNRVFATGYSNGATVLYALAADPQTAPLLAAIAPVRKGARVLDVCTGLAYTASGAARRGAQVTTIELDRAMTELCRVNPHSSELFSGNIRQLYGNGADVVPTLPDNSFDRIVHDPPTFALAGELFSETFYGHLLRILKPKGILYHYIGDPASKSAGNVAKGAAARLKKAGFGGVVIDYEAHGIIAARGRVKPTSRGKKKKAPDKRKPRAGAGPRREGRRGKRGRGGGSRRDDDDEGFLENEFF